MRRPVAKGGYDTAWLSPIRRLVAFQRAGRFIAAFARLLMSQNMHGYQQEDRLFHA
ncbi:hypothetical protein [Xanthomonas albilineans]|uniref:hypothetical protein n=1 Tax=Xanthomonas albilineans TaxID=29447 RepID=UPI000AB608A9|nr:hypothetical protein [Xanthomonas albilineans]